MGTDSLIAQDVGQTFAQGVARSEPEYETESTSGHEYSCNTVAHENRTDILDYYRLVNDTKAEMKLNEYDKGQLGAYANPTRNARYEDESTSMVTVDGIGDVDESTSMVTVDGREEWFDEEISSSLDVSQSSSVCVARSTSPVGRQSRPRLESPGDIKMDGHARRRAPVRETCGPGGGDIQEESLTEEGTEEHSYFRRAFIVLVLVVVAVTTIVVAFQFTGKDDSSRSEDGPPTPAPTFISNVLLQELEGVSGSEALSEPGSPQRTAVGWLSSIDESGIPATDSRLIQRYVLVVLYFATNGDQWLDRDNWLDPSQHECQWGSTITCKTDPSNHQIVIDLDLSTHNLKGELPPEIGYLVQIGKPYRFAKTETLSILFLLLFFTVEDFIMSSNSLNGTLPASLFNLRKLGKYSKLCLVV
jgi:hypothetical protein